MGCRGVQVSNLDKARSHGGRRNICLSLVGVLGALLVLCDLASNIYIYIYVEREREITMPVCVLYVCIYIYIYTCIYIYIYIYIYTYTHILYNNNDNNNQGREWGKEKRVTTGEDTANLRTKIMDFRGFDSSIILI